MKNIYILPTDKPSSGYVLGKCIKELSDVKIGEYTKTYYLMLNKEYFKPQNIYITSNEEIKEGYWLLSIFYGKIQYLDKCTEVDKTVDLAYNGELIKWTSAKHCKKIILTTDQDLIKDGVQAIDDEFLEWFVKNPSCEKIKVKNPLITKITDFGYKIIIPKEESKQEFVNSKVFSENGNELFFDKEGNLIKEEPKQETLEEVADEYAKNDNTKSYDFTSLILKDAFIEGAKWQQEQLILSDEEIDRIAKKHIIYNDSKRQWFIEGMKMYRDKIKINK